MERRRLDESEIAIRLESALGWRVIDGKLSKAYEFGDYASGVLFASSVAYQADRMDHHPDIAIGYRKVSLAVNTHDVGGISPFDFELARIADLVFEGSF